MSRLVIRMVASVRPGQVARVVTAVDALQRAAAGVDGIDLYEQYLDPTGLTFVAAEAYRDEAALTAHMGRADLGALLECVEIQLLQVHGDPSADLLATLSSIATTETFLPTTLPIEN